MAVDIQEVLRTDKVRDCVHGIRHVLCFLTLDFTPIFIHRTRLQLGGHIVNFVATFRLFVVVVCVVHGPLLAPLFVLMRLIKYPTAKSLHANLKCLVVATVLRVFCMW